MPTLAIFQLYRGVNNMTSVASSINVLREKNLFSKKSVFYYLKVCFWNRNKVALEAIIKLIYTSNVKHQRLIRPGYA
jgi:hypothetical protein